MCDCTQGSDPAQSQFWHNCLPNEEPIENLVYEQKDSLQSR